MAMTTEQMFKHMFNNDVSSRGIYKSTTRDFTIVKGLTNIFFYKGYNEIGHVPWGLEWEVKPMRRKVSFLEAVEAWYNGKTIQSVDPDNQDEVYDEYSRNRPYPSKALYITPAEVKSFIWYILEE